MSGAMPVRVLQVSAEIYPLLKTGGLADVAGALPAALQAQGCDVRVVLPGFAPICAGLVDAQPVGSFQTVWGETVRVVRGSVPGIPIAQGSLQAYVVLAAPLYERPGNNPYQDAQGHAYPDNHRRFAVLGWAAAHLAQGLDASWQPAIVHAHDWHAALAPACLALCPAQGRAPVPCIYTVHNLAYQGVFGPACFPDLGLPARAFALDGLEFYGQVSFMKAGLSYASHLSTVSPTYAHEIQTAEHGCGLDGLLRTRAKQLSGILNGVDAAVWNPSSDPHLAQPYDAHAMLGKAHCKAALQAQVGLPVRSDAPLFAVVSRLTEQKGMPLILSALDEILTRGGQLLVLGSGDATLEQAFALQAVAHPMHVAVRRSVDEGLAHRIFAGSDCTLVPSRFEPCGLTQLYGLRYGSLPLVRRVGGLADTVVDTDLASLDEGVATGFVFQEYTPQALRHALRRVFALYRKPALWEQVRAHAMAQRFDWSHAATQYAALYRQQVQG